MTKDLAPEIQIEYLEPGSIKELDGLIAGLAAKRILVVSGKRSFELSGAAEKLAGLFSSKQCMHLRHGPLVVRSEDLDPLLSELITFSPDLILAVGGGAAIDMAKALALSAASGETVSALVGKDLSNYQATRLIALPSTAGSGSQSTCFAAVYKEGRKFSLASPSLLPYAALVDAELTLSLPPYETACTGIDAFAQALESYWARGASADSRRYAKKALELCLSALLEAVSKGGLPARVQMAEAAHLAGKAINLTGTTGPHAFSYGFTYDFSIAHGHAVALTLPAFFAFNSEYAGENDERVEVFVELCSILQVGSADEAVGKVRKLISDCGLASTAKELKLKSADLATVAAKVDPKRLANNPRELPPDKFLQFLGDALSGG